MFERFRFCKNPDCGKEFEAIHPSADFDNDSCRNRFNYLRKLAKNVLGKDAKPNAIYAYMVLKCYLDRREKSLTVDTLRKMKVDFSAFGPVKPFAINDSRSVLQIGNLGLLKIDENYVKVVIMKK